MHIVQDGDTLIMQVSKEESEVIKEALLTFVNSVISKECSNNLTSKEKAINKEDKKIAFAIHSQFIKPTQNGQR